MKSFYFDQWVWVRLERAALDPESEPEFAKLLDVVRFASSSSLATFPLSSCHYLENYGRADRASRDRLARLMADISNLVTLANVDDLVGQEIEVYLCSLVGRTYQPPQAFGRGFVHAFGYDESEIEAIFSPTALLPPGVLRQVREQAELIVLGADVPSFDGEDPLSDALDWSALQAMHQSFGEANADNSKNIRDAGLAGRIQDPLMAQDLSALLPVVIPKCERLGIDPTAVFPDKRSCERFFESVPVAWITHQLRVARYQDANGTWKPNDLHDMRFLPPAIAYCDVVMTERSWAHHCRRRGVDAQMEVLITSSVDEVLATLVR